MHAYTANPLDMYIRADPAILYGLTTGIRYVLKLNTVCTDINDYIGYLQIRKRRTVEALKHCQLFFWILHISYSPLT